MSNKRSAPEEWIHARRQPSSPPLPQGEPTSQTSRTYTSEPNAAMTSHERLIEYFKWQRKVYEKAVEVHIRDPERNSPTPFIPLLPPPPAYMSRSNVAPILDRTKTETTRGDITGYREYPHTLDEPDREPDHTGYVSSTGTNDAAIIGLQRSREMRFSSRNFIPYSSELYPHSKSVSANAALQELKWYIHATGTPNTAPARTTPKGYELIPTPKYPPGSLHHPQRTDAQEFYHRNLHRHTPNMQLMDMAIYHAAGHHDYPTQPKYRRKIGGNPDPFTEPETHYLRAIKRSMDGIAAKDSAMMSEYDSDELSIYDQLWILRNYPIAKYVVHSYDADNLTAEHRDRAMSFIARQTPDGVAGMFLNQEAPDFYYRDENGYQVSGMLDDDDYRRATLNGDRDLEDEAALIVNPVKPKHIIEGDNFTFAVQDAETGLTIPHPPYTRIKDQGGAPPENNFRRIMKPDKSPFDADRDAGEESFSKYIYDKYIRKNIIKERETAYNYLIKLSPADTLEATAPATVVDVNQMFRFYRDEVKQTYRNFTKQYTDYLRNAEEEVPPAPGLSEDDITHLLGHYYEGLSPLLMPGLDKAIENAEHELSRYELSNGGGGLLPTSSPLFQSLAFVMRSNYLDRADAPRDAVPAIPGVRGRSIASDSQDVVHRYGAIAGLVGKYLTKPEIYLPLYYTRLRTEAGYLPDDQYGLTINFDHFRKGFYERDARNPEAQTQRYMKDFEKMLR